MIWILLVVIVLLAVIFGVASISQSYASARQAEAAIEASRAAQVSSAGNLVTILLAALLVIAVLFALGMIAWLYYQFKLKPQLNAPKGDWLPGPNAGWQRNEATGQKPTMNDLLPAMLTMLMIQMMQQQQLSDSPTFPQSNSTPAVEDLDDIWTL